VTLPDVQSGFLVAVLGADGADAIQRAVQKSEELARVLVPRTLLSWSALVGAYGYEGPLPGVERTYLSFSKSESGSYSGALTVGDDTIPFEDASVYRLAAHMAVVLQLDDGIPAQELRAMDLTKLGKSIDLLVRTRVASEALQKAAPFSMPGIGEAAHRTAVMRAIPNRQPGMAPGASLVGQHPSGLGPTSISPTKITPAPGPAMKPPSPQTGPSPGFSLPTKAESEHRSAIFQGAKTPVPAPAAPVQAPTKVDKAELPGQQAKPLQQVGAMAPQAPTKQPKQQKPPKPKLPALKVAKAELGVACNICGRVQFQDGRFVGCMCFQVLAKGVRTTPIATGDVVLTFGSSWDLPAIEVLIEALHGPQ
jgi:hypothetical protein